MTASEIVKPCGEALETGGEEAVGWLEKRGWVTPAVALTRTGEYVMGPFVPAGRVTISNELELSAGERVELISLASRGKFFERRVSREGARSEYQLPAGKAIGIHVDRKGHVLAVSRPVIVVADRLTTVRPTAPTEGSDVIAILQRPRHGENVDDETIGVVASTAAGTRDPDVFATSQDAVIAGWYGVAAGRILFDIRSATVRLANRELEVGRRSAALVRAKLETLPALTVAIASLPVETTEHIDSMALTIRTSTEHLILRQQAVRPGEEYHFEYLPATSVTATLEIDAWRMDVDADLSSGADVSVSIPLEPITVTGTVYHGRDPAPAELRFLQGAKPVVIRTDDEGRYSAMFWRPGRYFLDSTVLAHASRPPFRSVVTITGTQTLDVHIPDFRLQARVYDVEDGRSVAGTITLRSIYLGSHGRESDVLAIPTADSGFTELPPVRAGTVELRVAADGYEQSDPITLPIDGASTGRTVDIPMRPVGETVRLLIRLADGRPAVGAEIAFWRGGVDLTALTKTDTEGVANVAAGMTGAMALIRHPAGGSSVFRFDASAGKPATLQLPPAAPPLLLHVREEVPGTGVPARLTAWFNGQAVDGSALAFLTWSSSGNSHAGSWIARNLPARPLKIVAISVASQWSRHPAALEAMADVVPFPWSDSPSVTMRR